MRPLTIAFIALSLSCTSPHDNSVDNSYFELLSSRLELAGFNVDTIIQTCEEGMITGKYFTNGASHNYLDFINQVKKSNDVSTQKWLIDQETRMALMALDLSYNLDSVPFNSINATDSSSIIYKGMSIKDEVSKQRDISPKVITESVLKYMKESDFDSPLYRLLFFKFLVRTVDVDKGLSVMLPDYPDDETNVHVDPNLVLEVVVDDNDQLMVLGKTIDLNELTILTKNFLQKTPQVDSDKPSNMPQKIVSLKNSRGTSYAKYSEVYNEIVRAYKEVRNQIAQEEFGNLYKDLDKPEQGIIQKLVPMRISEAEPVDY
ncbi:MAG: hypothetical protein ACI9JN_001320 [Bacteroidia bacterium]|jgi:hypothetical protein